MDKNEIGLNAGKVWQLLSNNDKWSYGNLKKKSGLKDKDLGAALGWLAREDKIEFEQEEEELYVYLCVNVYIGIIFYFSFFFAAKFCSIRKEATNPAPPKRRVHEP